MTRYEDDWAKAEETCFIATVAYGTPIAEEVEILREFRDDFLLHNPMGKAFVAVYYKVGPPIAGFISEHQLLRTVVRACCVAPAAALVKLTESWWAE